MARPTKLPPIASGQRYARLTALEFVGRGVRNCAIWKFRCDCGKEVVNRAAQVRYGTAKSCGCLAVENGARTGSMIKHGLYGTPEYRSWNRMLDRCRNKNSDAYKDYGGRGISVCDRWLKFENFFSDMAPRPKGHTLDRIENNGNYEPGNCKWSTLKEQAGNRRNPTLGGPLPNNKSGVRGVYQMPDGKWRALINTNGARDHLGYFDRLEGAANAVTAARNGRAKS